VNDQNDLERPHRPAAAQEPYQLDTPGKVTADDALSTHDSGDSRSAGQADVEPVVVPRWVQASLLTLALLVLIALAWAAAPVLLTFVVAGIIALVINPLVELLQRARVPRGLAIAAVFVSFFAALAGVVALLIRPITNQAAAFQDDLPALIDSANASLAKLQTWLGQHGIGIQIAAPGETALHTLQTSILRGSGDVVSFTRDLVATLAEAGFALILLLVITIYMLIYGHQIGSLARQLMPPGDGTAHDDYPTRIQRAVSGYIRAQLTFSAIMGLSAGIALWIFGAFGVFPAGRTYAVFFGAYYGLMELIPYLGPILGAAPPILIALLQGEPLTALWLLILFVVLQQLEGHIVAPQVFGHHLRINPLLVIFALLLGAHLYGITGALIALPIAAMIRETAIYLRRHLLMEPWGTPSAAALTDTQTDAADDANEPDPPPRLGPLRPRRSRLLRTLPLSRYRPARTSEARAQKDD
jgi:predicted PurR-regulated permease PerM